MARRYEQLRYVPDSQESALFKTNITQNDVQMKWITSALDEKLGTDHALYRMIEQDPVHYLTDDSIIKYLTQQRSR